jgi:hypothetical protein
MAKHIVETHEFDLDGVWLSVWLSPSPVTIVLLSNCFEEGLGTDAINDGAIGRFIRPKVFRASAWLVWVGVWVGNSQRNQRLSVRPCRSKGVPLIPSTVKNVEDVCAAARLAIVDQVLPCGEALHSSDVACRLTRIWMLSEQPETLGNRVNYSVCNLQTRPIGPIQEDLIQIPLRTL